MRVSLKRASKEYPETQSLRRERVAQVMPSLARFARSLRRKRRERLRRYRDPHAGSSFLWSLTFCEQAAVQFDLRARVHRERSRVTLENFERESS